MGILINILTFTFSHDCLLFFLLYVGDFLLCQFYGKMATVLQMLIYSNYFHKAVFRQHRRVSTKEAE